MFVGICKWWEFGFEFDFDVVDSSCIVEIVGIFVELVFVVWGFVVLVLIDVVMIVVFFDVVYVGLWLYFIV